MASDTTKRTPEDFAREGINGVSFIFVGWPWFLGFVIGIIAGAIAGWGSFYPPILFASIFGAAAVFITARRRGASIGQALGAAFLGAPYLYFMKRRAQRRSVQEQAG